LINYLTQYAEAYYKPVRQELKLGNIDALRNYFTDIYKKEEWPVKINCDEHILEIEQDACPGISQIRAKGDEPCPYYIETYNTLYKSLCKDTTFEYQLEYFDEVTGACKQVFRKKITF